jgi:hypothetical protein
MIVFLRCAFSLVLAAMIWVTMWASLQVPIWQIPPGVGGHPWFIATLFDTYFAFLTFFCWVAYKENSVWRSVLWLLGILLLGNFAIASFCLIQLFKVHANAPLRDVLLRK